MTSTSDHLNGDAKGEGGEREEGRASPHAPRPRPPAMLRPKPLTRQSGVFKRSFAAPGRLVSLRPQRIRCFVDPYSTASHNS